MIIFFTDLNLLIKNYNFNIIKLVNLKKTALSFIFFLSFASEIYGGELEIYINTAVRNRKELKIAQDQVDLAKFRVLATARMLGPSVNFEYSQSEGETIDSPYISKSYGLKVEQTLFMGGRKYYTLKRELETLEIAKFNFQRLKQEVKFETAKAYYIYKNAREKLKNINELIFDVHPEFEMAEKKFKAGIITEVDYLEIKNMREKLLLQKGMQDDSLHLAELKLKQACEMDFITMTDSSIDENIEEIGYTVDECVRIALRNRPEYNSLESSVKQAEYDKKTVESFKWPNLSLVGFIGKSGEYYQRNNFAYLSEWSVIARATWQFWGNAVNYDYVVRKTPPSDVLDTAVKTESRTHSLKAALLDDLSYFYRKKEKKIALEQTKATLEKMEKKIKEEVEEAYLSVKNAGQQAEFAKKNLDLSRKKLRIVEKRKLLGEASSKEIINAKMNLVNQQNSYIEALAKYRFALIQLNMSVGADLIGE